MRSIVVTSYRFIVSHRYALIILLLGLALHFWYIFLHPSTILYGGPGDHTAGLIWLYEQSPQNPWWTFSHMSAYPFGDNLWNPAYVLGQAFYIYYWVCATIAHNGVAGYNLLVVTYLAASYLTVYSVIIRLTNVRKITAAITSYIAAFSPFLLFLSGVGHASYMLAPGWAALLFYCIYQVLMGSGRKWHYICAILLLGLSWLHDPYFVLFAWLLFLGESIGIMAKTNKIYRKDFVRRFLIVCGLSALLFIPVGVYSIIESKDLQKNTYDVRSDIRSDVNLYSMRAKDLLLPSQRNSFMPSAVRQYKLQSFHGTDPTFTVYIGWSTLVILAVSILMSVFYKVQWSRAERHLVFVCGIAICFMFLFSTPPYLSLGGLKIPTFTYLLTEITGIWRVLARIYIFVLPVYLIVVALCLDKIISLISIRRIRGIILLLVLVIFIIDFLPRNPFNLNNYWDIEHSIPASYKIIKSDPTIKVVAEYPLREAPHYRGSIYFTAQLFHQKPLINSTQAVTDQTLLRESLMDLNNPQTIRTLRLLGADTINVWQNGTQQWWGNDQVTRITNARYSSMFGGNDQVTLFKIKESVAIDPLARYVATLDMDSRMTNGEYLHEVLQTVPKDFNVRIVDVCNLKEVHQACINYPAIKQGTYKASFKNESTDVRHVTLQYQQAVQSYTIYPGEILPVTVPLDSLDDRVHVHLDESYKMSIVGGHVELHE